MTNEKEYFEVPSTTSIYDVLITELTRECNRARAACAMMQEAIRRMAKGRLEIRWFALREYPYPTEPGWYWSVVCSGEYTGWIGPFDTVTTAALAAMQEAEEKNEQ